MRLIVAGQEAVTASEFAELAFGIDVELFTGADDETAADTVVRLDVARDVLRDLAPEPARYASALMRTAERNRTLVWKAAA
ncbi:hypothetical protein K353_02499 [Kitasatospora sp. SolWspMP-SS2h]|uniref:hypothetical protein n=1 Tax=Kitasatospora sp. SolWspMP-SS2h TaxID=1305729 RepID=UPI000DC0184B|nr:hypothetical protein [Kitasatospora sp. SolWspMP-SS2h]RAJ42822.1 hypothetical protein K353_02499 [Kitasatospora sp. SolWspMP-SS2h]